MLCVACGGDVPVGSRFCPRCGRAAPTPEDAAPMGAGPPSTPPPGPPTMPPPPPPPPPGFGGGPGFGAPPAGYGAPPGPSGGFGAPAGGYGPPPGSFPSPPPGSYPGAPYGGAGGGPVPYGLASFGQRVGAFLLDMLITWGIFIFGMIVVGVTTPTESFDNPNPDPSGIGILVMMLSWVAAFAYPIVFEGRPEGQTLGKKALGIRVVRRVNGGPLGYGLAIGRALARMLEGFTFGIGLLWAAWDPMRQTLHDKLAGTLVVRSSVYPPPNAAPGGYQQPAPPPNPYN